MRWYPTMAQAIAAFERASKRAGIAPPQRYLPSVSGDSITTNDIAYPRSTSVRMRAGHGWVYVDVCNEDRGIISERGHLFFGRGALPA